MHHVEVHVPLLNLGDINSLCLDDATVSPLRSYELGRAGFRLLAYMAWPADKTMRNGFLASLGSISIGQLDEVFSDMAKANQAVEQVLNVVSREVRQYDLLPFGGHMATAMAPGMPEFDRILQDRVPAWCAVGEALSLTYRTFRFHQDQLKGGASISKSLDLLEELGVSNRKYLRNWWSEFKCVAHLCASVVVVSEIIAPALRKRYPDQVTSGFPFFAGLGATLAFGREFQKFWSF